MIPRGVGARARDREGVGRLGREVLGVVRTVLEGGEGARGLSIQERVLFIDNLLVRNHFIIVMIRWTGRGGERLQQSANTPGSAFFEGGEGARGLARERLQQLEHN